MRRPRPASPARAHRPPVLPDEDPRARPGDEADAASSSSADGSRLIFYFTADGRVDFRELVRDLAAEFRTRIEMRQIGVRDEARMLGGYGACGRPLCCTTWLQSFEPVSIKMAKQQKLSLNPSKLSGLCGRLKCCLRYELPDGGRATRRPRRGGCDGAGDAAAGAAAAAAAGCLRQRQLRGLRAPSRASARRTRRMTCSPTHRASPSATRRASARRSSSKALADPRVLEVCEPVRYGPDARRGRASGSRPGRCPPRPGGPPTTRSCAAVARRAGRDASTPSPRRRSTRRRSRWPACPGRGTPTCWPTCAARRGSR